LKQDRLAKELLNPANKTLLEAGNKAGYTSKHIYRKSTKKHLAEIFASCGVTQESLREAYEVCGRLCLTKGDYSTLKATIDSLARLYGHLRDNPNVNIALFDSSMLKDLPPIDATPPIT
jgi:hypothetical protein